MSGDECSPRLVTPTRAKFTISTHNRSGAISRHGWHRSRPTAQRPDVAAGRGQAATVVGVVGVEVAQGAQPELR